MTSKVNPKAADIILTDRQTVIGREIINLLGLKVKTNGRVDTSHGDKTPLGLYLTVKRYVDKVPNDLQNAKLFEQYKRTQSSVMKLWKSLDAA